MKDKEFQQKVLELLEAILKELKTQRAENHKTRISVNVFSWVKTIFGLPQN